MKKLLSILLCINLLTTPVLAEYDFSDEAQAKFNAEHQQIQPEIKDDFSKAKEKRKKYKEKTQQELLYNEEATKQTPDQLYPPNSEIIEVQQPKQELLVPLQKQNQRFYGSVVTIPMGSSFNITFDSGINSGSMEKDDRLAVRLTNDLEYNGIMVAPAGSLVYGTTTNSKRAELAYGSAELELNFNEIMTPDGKLLQISTEKIYMHSKSERAKNMTRDVILGALGSMLVGAAFTALGGSDNWGRNMAIYGGLGAIGGGIRGVAQRGEEVDIQDGTTIQIKLTQPLTAPAYSL